MKIFYLMRAFCVQHQYYISLFYLIVNIGYTSKHYEYLYQICFYVRLCTYNSTNSNPS